MTSPIPSILVLACAMFVGAATTGFSQGLERTAQAGGVTASVTPINLTDTTADMISFKVELNTHSFPLAFDIAKIALLSDGKDLIEPASAWSGGKGGHHISGTLSFPAASLRDSETIILSLTGAGGGEDLSFVWKGPF
ncbi:MAG: hypothetical protein ABSG17_19745 [Spirochaetia bacterium]|jgi:hypothetical protein